MNQCEDFEVLISAVMDGDLSVAESTQLEVHMHSCSGCRALHARFEQVDLLVAGHDLDLQPSQIEPDDDLTQVPEHELWNCAAATVWSVDHRESPLLLSKPLSPTSYRKKRSPSGRFDIRQAMVTAGTLAAVGVVALLANSGSNPPAESGEDYDFVTPVSQITRLNHQSQDAQRNLADTFEMQLRLLKVETAAAKSSLPVETQTELDKLTSRIEALRQQLKDFNSTPSL